MLKHLLRFIKTEDLEREFVSRYTEDMDAPKLTEEEIAEFFDNLSNIELARPFLNSIMKADRIRFFNAPKDGQDLVRGAFFRTFWMLKSLNKEPKTKKTGAKLSSPFHG